MSERPYGHIAVELADGVMTVTLDRAKRKNAMGPQMVNELLYALDDAKANEEVRVIVITGAHGTFCAGGDLQHMSSDAEAKLEPKGDYADLLLRFPALGKPTIAKVRGVALGGGLGLVASCDFAIAARSSRLGTPEVRHGLFPMMIMAVLARVVSRRRLLELMLLGESIVAERAAQIELISEVVDDDALDDTTSNLAARLAAQSSSAMRMGLAAYHRQAELRLREAVPWLQEQFLAILVTEDAQEGLRAFIEKRAPVWSQK